MIKLSVEVRSGAARFDVAVQAESTQRALGLVTRRYPAMTCRVKFPIEPGAGSLKGAIRPFFL
jgi:hypothetical protein